MRSALAVLLAPAAFSCSRHDVTASADSPGSREVDAAVRDSIIRNVLESTK